MIPPPRNGAKNVTHLLGAATFVVVFERLIPCRRCQTFSKKVSQGATKFEIPSTRLESFSLGSGNRKFIFDRDFVAIESDELSPRRNTPPRIEYGGGVSDPTDQLLNELLAPAITRPMLSLNGGGVFDPTTEAERTLGTCCHQAHALIPVITVVNPCRRDLTLASRGVRIAVTDLTPFLPIRSYEGLTAKILFTFHPTAETPWDSTR
ncbi:hypothetical protein PIB30_033884 [Stylosanthes scabra]|uniref:Uncharacterized protein n=1 Tax=Stylosanthes scabra TaxID=79078 RepID=A0ABU6TCD6_9FABA|nr:hypothetical protein [Stylosanthes scabra]